MKVFQFSLILCWICFSSAYLLSQNEYFYVNSSYGRGVMTVSMNFKIDNFKEIKLEGAIGKQLKGAIGTVLQQRQIDFANAFNEERIGYNNFDAGEYWFSFKHQLPNIAVPSFFSLNLTLINQNIVSLELLLPLFTMPLSAFPVNSMSLCHETTLISSVYAFGVQDLFLVSQSGKWEASEHHDWGFWQNQGSITYLRYKRRGNGHLKVKSEHKQCGITPKVPKNALKIDKSVISFAQLLKYSIPSISQQQIENDL